MSDDDERKLTSANENPWYWLATVYGEQAGTETWDYDEDLAAKNRIAWNRWMASALSDERRQELIAKGFDASELTTLSSEEQTEFLKRFAARAGQEDTPPPDPNEHIESAGVHFERQVSFRGFTFLRYASFWKATFSGNAYFHKAAFSGGASFNAAAFSGGASFKEATFSEFAFFSEARFSRYAAFYEATFSGTAKFSKSVFSGDAFFYEATFSGDADFSEAAFSGDADFSEAAFSGDADFNRGTFSGVTNFMGAAFQSHTVFSDRQFQKSVPDFRDAKLREATEWHGAIWPPSPNNKDDAQQQVYAYERLKAEMERLKKHADEQFFFAKELRARRALEPRWSLQWLFNYAYEISSFYGQSVGWPLFWLVVLFAVGADFFALVPVHGGAPLAWDVAAGLSVTNLFPLLPYKPKVEELSTSAQIIGDVQSVLGLILLFLLGLGLRNRFRMK